MSTEQRKAARAAAAGRGANVWSDARARKSGAARGLIIHVCRHAPMATSVIKAAGKAAANAGPARAFADSPGPRNTSDMPGVVKKKRNNEKENIKNNEKRKNAHKKI